LEDVFEFGNTIPLKEINENPKVWESLNHWKIKDFEYTLGKSRLKENNK